MKNDFEVTQTISGKDRLFEIIGVLKKHNILDGINPVKLREILEDLGPTFIKIGQILSYVKCKTMFFGTFLCTAAY